MLNNVFSAYSHRYCAEVGWCSVDGACVESVFFVSNGEEGLRLDHLLTYIEQLC